MYIIITITSWVLLCIVASTLLKYAIVSHIYKKPPISLTVIDLAYGDSLFYLYLYEINFGLTIILCSASDSLTLSFELSFGISVTNYFILSCCLWSVAISGLLRFVSLINNSEEIGIQSLGPDYLAIWKIRLMSFSFTLLLLLSGIMCFHSIPIFFYTLYIPVKTPYASIYEQDPYTRMYVAPVVCASVSSLAPKMYTLFTTKMCTDHAKEKFVLSLANALGFPLFFFLIASFQFFDRFIRLTVCFPIVLIYSCFILPIIIILRNDQIRKDIFEKVKNIFVSFSSYFNLGHNEVFPLEE